MSDYDEIELAEKIAKELISKVPGLEDLASFYVMTYTDEELEEMGEEPGDWVGQYVRGSIDSNRGPIVLINISKHQEVSDLIDTLCHEMGHGLWELLTKPAKRLWKKAMQKEKINPEEAFADDFMYLVRGSVTFMNDEKLFRELTRPV